MRRRVIDADVTVPVAITVSIADAESESGARRRRIAVDQSADDSKSGTAAGNGDAPEQRACRRRVRGAVEQRHDHGAGSR